MRQRGQNSQILFIYLALGALQSLPLVLFVIFDSRILLFLSAPLAILATFYLASREGKREASRLPNRPQELVEKRLERNRIQSELLLEMQTLLAKGRDERDSFESALKEKQERLEEIEMARSEENRHFTKERQRFLLRIGELEMKIEGQESLLGECRALLAEQRELIEEKEQEVQEMRTLNSELEEEIQKIVEFTPAQSSLPRFSSEPRRESYAASEGYHLSKELEKALRVVEEASSHPIHSPFLELSHERMVLDLPLIHSKFPEMGQHLISMLYSPLEKRALTVSSTASLLGYSSDSFAKLFFQIVEKEAAKWSEALRKLTFQRALFLDMNLKSYGGALKPFHLALGLIQRGPLEGLILVLFSEKKALK